MSTRGRGWQAVFILAVLMLAALSASPPGAAQTSQGIYLPLIYGQTQGCNPNPQEADIAQRMKSDPQQGRTSLTCHPLLERVARERAQDMATRRYFDHVNPDGHGPNYLVLQAGYKLPGWWEVAANPRDNFIESISGGYPTPAAAWQSWMGSSGHRTHILGLNDFWKEQIFYGIGYVYDENSEFGHYWVVITAPPEE